MLYHTFTHAYTNTYINTQLFVCVSMHIYTHVLRSYQGNREPESLAAPFLTDSSHIVPVGIPDCFYCGHNHQHLSAARVRPKASREFINVKAPRSPHAKLLVQFLPFVQTCVGQRLRRAFFFLFTLLWSPNTQFNCFAPGRWS
jgi:hypothetical protein